MVKIIIALVALVALTGCGGGSSDTTGTQGDTYTVTVSNTGNGDVIVNTGSGVITINQQDQCLVKLDDNSTRPCTSDETNTAYNALYSVK